ncbi:G-protein coupled receptor dmsr-1-like [Mercenaria mercenaria]|uniref:G-protein coupled receptor dmsr-1-like n=1 Tax=Mercenaria mercenaria TaxID=6596 RepID=UPI00234E46F2|nr:G-protein coupled receptor dmsr-1-like [Mercenaria mercenaria]
MSESLQTTDVTWSNTQYPTVPTVTDSPFIKLQKDYRKLHGYISCIVCIFGLSSNIINMIVLTRKHMIKPVNFILTALAGADFLTMLTYLVYAAYFYIAKEPIWQANHTYAWMCFIMIHNHFIIICHNMSLWFTVYLAVLRYKFVCNNTFGYREYSLKRTIITVTIISNVILVLCIPNFFMYKVIALSDIVDPNVSGYWIVDSDFVKKHIFYKVSIFWFFGVVMKILPCILLTFFICRIIHTMYRSEKQREQLQEQARLSTHGRHRDNIRTTRMLIAVVLICVLTEMPQGIFALISCLDDRFFEDIYSNIGDILDLLVLFNSSVNFILYCSMSRQYRDTFRKLFSFRTAHCHNQLRQINHTR